jgi:hypothetical protein
MDAHRIVDDYSLGNAYRACGRLVHSLSIIQEHVYDVTKHSDPICGKESSKERVSLRYWE